MNAQAKEYFQGIGWVYYDLVLQEAYSDTDSKRKFYKLKRFAKASCKAKFGYERKANSKYRKEFSKRIDVSDCEIHHEIDGRIYAIPKAIHKKIPHYGFISLRWGFFIFKVSCNLQKKIKISLDKLRGLIQGDQFSHELSSSIFTISEIFLEPELPNPETSIKILAPRDLPHKDPRGPQDRIDFSYLDPIFTTTSYKVIIDTFIILWYNIYVNKVRE